MKTNPYVWFGTMNEPHTDYGAAEAAISVQEQATYQAIRNAGNNAPILMELLGGGNPGTIGAGAGMTASAYASMTNIVWDLHYYGWAAGNNPGQTLQTLIGQAQTITSRDGIVPVIVGEFGNSTTGNGIDGNGQAVVQAVVDAGRNGIGSAAWKWGTGGGGGGDGLQNGDGSLSAFGSTVAQFTQESGATGCFASPIPAPLTTPAMQAATAADTAANDLSVADVARLAAQGLNATGNSVGTTAQLASTDATGAAPGGTLTATDPTTAAVLAMGPAPDTAPIDRTVASPIGTMPTPAPVSASTTYSADRDYQTVVSAPGNGTGSVSGTGNTITATGGIQTVSVTGPGNTITTGPYDDIITVRSSGNTISTGGGNDTVILAYPAKPPTAANAAAVPVAPLASAGNIFVVPAPGTGLLTIQGKLASNDQIDLTKALAGTTWNGNPSTMRNYISETASAQGSSIAVGGITVLQIPSGNLGPFIVAGH